VFALTSAGQLSEQGEKTTRVITVDELFPSTGSFDVAVTEAVLVIVEPCDALTLTISVMLADPPAAIDPSEHCTAPVPPGGGAVKVP